MSEKENSIFYRWPAVLQLINPFCMLGFVAFIFVAVNQPNLSGTELYATIPLTYSICCFVFYTIIPFQKGGFGLKVFYVVATCRYVVLPILTCIVGHFTNETFSSSSYVYAIVMTDIELVVSCLAIKHYYPIFSNRIKDENKEKVEYYDELGIGGLMVLVGSMGLIAVRGVDTLQRSMRFGVVSTKLTDEALYSYDIWLAHTLLAFCVIGITSFFCKRNEKKTSIINIILPVVSVGISCMMIFGNNRMIIVYFALSGLTVLFRAFPKYKGVFVITIIPVFLVVMVSFTMMKQYSIDVTSSGRETVGAEQLVQTLTSYICGIENVAKTIERYSVTGNQMSFLTFFSDIVHNTKILGLPILSKIPRLMDGIPTSVDLATTSTEMVSVCGQTFFFGGGILAGWLLDIVAYIFIMRFLVIFDINAKVSESLGTVYVFTWLSVLFGMTMCYCLETLYAGMTYVPFFTWIFLTINRKIRMRWSRIKKEISK